MVAINGQDGVEKILDDDLNIEVEDEEDGEHDGVEHEVTEDDESDDDTDEHNFEHPQNNLSIHTNKILSIAQDIIYATGRGKKLTPKHIGLAVALHQKRSRKLVDLLNRAGHCATYRQLQQIYTALAEVTLDTLDYSTGAVIPSNLTPYPTGSQHDRIDIPPFLHITADNIDKITDTLDGKNSFHGTQMVVFQRGAKSSDHVLSSLRLKQKVSLQVPAVMTKIFEPEIKPRSEPVLISAAKLEWYASDPKAESVKIAESKDLSFIMSRESMDSEKRIGWTEYNKTISINEAGITASAFMPLILNPAHEYGKYTQHCN